ncbi:sodium/potassium/calcium exchanger 4-like isoform X2 [Montipora foliosa]
MTRRRRFKVQLGFAVVVSLFLFFGWSFDDRIDETAGIPITLSGELSDGSFTRRDLLAREKDEPKNCTPPSIAEFPKDLFNQHQRRLGAVIIHFLVAFYMSWGIAIVCDDYFVPCLELIADKMGLQSDVAGATFMAFGSSAPELFASVIGVFITQGDIGIGTILGSAVFNVLFVIGACGIGAGTVLYLAWWPLVRDNMFYLLSVAILIVVLIDGVVTWPEALAMACSYSIYIIIMYFNKRIEAWVYKITNTGSPEFKSDLHASNGIGKAINNGYENIASEEKEESQEEEKSESVTTKEQPDPEKEKGSTEKGDDKEQEKIQDEKEEDDGEAKPLMSSGGDHLKHRPVPDLTLGTPFNPPEGLAARLCWFIGLPINIAYYFTIPDVKKESCHNWVAVTFIACIFWIGVSSYTLVWMVTIIGYTFGIPDAIMGLTLVAFGSSIPDCSSSLFIARKGDGDMAVSNTVGSNTFDILLCLGVPWFIKTTLWGNHEPIVVSSRGLFMSCFFILGSVAIAFFVLFLNKWVLNRKVGCVFIVIYLIFLAGSIFVEMYVFAGFNPSMCIVDV